MATQTIEDSTRSGPRRMVLGDVLQLLNLKYHRVAPFPWIVNNLDALPIQNLKHILEIGKN